MAFINHKPEGPMSRTALIYRVEQLPAAYAPCALYIVKTPNTNLYDLFLTSSDGQAAERIITDSDVGAMLAANSNKPNGLLTLDSNSLIPVNRLPQIPSTNITSSLTVDTSGNAGSATKLKTARNINGVAFDGSVDITIPAVDTATPRIASSEKGVANGVATLDSGGKVPATQLPSYVDDVLEFANLAGFPATGESGKIYVALDTNKAYRWTGSVYIQVNSSVSSADTAVKLASPRTLSLTGDGAWSVTFDGSQNVTGALVLANSGVIAGDYPVVTVNAKGLVTSGRALSQADIPSLPGSKITSSLLVDTTGNAGSATKLQTARNINGVAFDGTTNITVSAVDTVTPRIASTEKGVANGVATLDSTGKIPSGQLPSFVDDVLEYTNQASFPTTGESGKIYLALDTGKIYRWSGTVYLEINSSVASADSAIKLATSRSISMTGDGAWSVNFDGSANVTGALVLSNTGVTAGTYPVVTTNSKGLITSGRALLDTDIPSLPGSKITSALSVNTTGNAATATKLATARTINGVNFDGSANITINAVDSTARVASSLLGVANGVATLDSTGKVPTGQLPSYVDDVLEFTNLAAFPATGETGKIYVALDTNKVYRWTGSVYIQVNASVSSADTATKLATARLITLTGDVSLSFYFDGSQDITGPLTLNNTGVTAGEYAVMTTNAKGLITSGRALTAADIPSLPGSKITSALTVDTSGNADTATKLATPRTINGVNFDGSANITINAVDSTSRVPWSSVGAPNGVASLDANSKMMQVPLYVDGQDTILTSNGQPIWAELVKEFMIKATNGTSNNPTFGATVGNMQGLIFSASTLQQVWVDFTIPHDYEVGTEVFPKLNWMPLTTATGTVVWGMEYVIAKRDGSFTAASATTITIAHSISTNSQFKNMASEPQNAGQGIPGTLLEPGAVIKMRIYRDAANALDTYGDTTHAWQMSLHYQVGQLGTRGRLSNYFA